jgi:hypothetical protein
MGYKAAGPGQLLMAKFSKFDGGLALKTFFKFLAKQGQWMTPEAKAQACIVGDKVLSLGWNGQQTGSGQLLFAGGILQDARKPVVTRGKPVSLMPVVAKALKGAGCSQCLQVLA